MGDTNTASSGHTDLSARAANGFNSNPFGSGGSAGTHYLRTDWPSTAAIYETPSGSSYVSVGDRRMSPDRTTGTVGLTAHQLGI